MYIVSACLAGINCRYDGKNNENKLVRRLVEEGKAMPVCPEVLGGLTIPRVCCEIIEDKEGGKRVVSKNGEDFTSEFLDGAQKTLQIAKVVGAETAVLQLRSPSCGYGYVYDGTFSGNYKKGNGLTAELLRKNNIAIYTEEDIDKIVQDVAL